MDREKLAERFEAERTRLHSVALRLLGSSSEADDAVQESWLRLARSYSDEVHNLSAFMTTLVGRACLDMLRSRQSRRELPLTEEGETVPDAADPEREAVMAESVGVAMIAVQERLAPAERVAFVLHDVFNVSFDEIAGIVGRTPVAARQLASRGRRAVRGASEDTPASDVAKHRDVVEAFFKASRAGDLAALLAVLDPEVILRPDAAALQMGMRNGWITGPVRGAEAVAQRFSGNAQAAQLALVDGEPGAVWAAGGVVRVAFIVTLTDGAVSAIDLVADPERIAQMRFEILS
jgi:RNA polymerase sigma-70 factor (ECF subfamily)